jgi:hypothetical protein
MTTTIAEAKENAPATGSAGEPKPPHKATVGAQKPGGAPSQGKSANNKAPAKKAPKGQKKGPPARQGSKTARIIALLEKPKGATLATLMTATGWQAHSVRGFISGTLGKKMGLKVKSAKRQDGERVYAIQH